VELQPDGKAEPVIARNPAILYGLGNLVENAVDFASEAVTVAAHWDSQEVEIVVTDDGPGFAPEVINRIGEPYVTMRGRPRSDDGEGPGGGLGLGFFIAKTLLERSGASLSLENRVFPQSGAIVTVRWPRSALELNLNQEASARSGPSGDTKQPPTLASGGTDN
jgi:two-component system, sensor histidine kinase RegB